MFLDSWVAKLEVFQTQFATLGFSLKYKCPCSNRENQVREQPLEKFEKREEMKKEEEEEEDWDIGFARFEYRFWASSRFFSKQRLIQPHRRQRKIDYLLYLL